MSKKILTITVPAYNAESYLKRCLDSFKLPEVMDKIEVLVINDGSADGTASVAEEYVEKYPNTYKLINKENGGHGSGVNTGIQNATGYYFKVVDADDWVDTSVFADYIGLLLKLKEESVDVVASDYVSIEDETYREIRHYPATEDASEYGSIHYMKEWKPSKVIKMHSMTIRTSILKENYRALDEHCFYVDAEYITFPVPYIKSVYYDKRSLYQYRLGREGQSMAWASMVKNKDMHLRVLNRLIDFYDEVAADLQAKNKEYLQRCIGDMIDNQFQIYIITGHKPSTIKEVRNWDKKIKKEHPSLYRATSKKSITWIRKTNYLLMPIAKLAHKIVKG